MLNVAKMAPGSEDYYLAQTVGYYLGRGEPPGRWIGRGLDRLGLEGQVEAEPLKAVLAGHHPISGEKLARHPARKVPGFDLAFRAPKSVSLLWALGDQHVADEVLAAHRAAVDAAVGYVEREAVRSRRGAGGTERVQVDGLIAAGFDHRTSRAGDPLLNSRVLCANLARTTDDGVWRTLDSRRLYLHAKTAGFLYQAQLRRELTVRLGMGWGPVVNGCADIDGIDRKVIEAFSTRRRQILAELEERGESSAKAAQVATLTTRDPKGMQPTEVELRERWAAQARDLGFDPEQLGRLLHRHVAELPPLEDLVAELVDGEALTEQAATFDRRDLLQAVAERLPDGAAVEDVEALADAVVAAGREHLVALGPLRGRLSQVDSIRTADGNIVAGGLDDQGRMTTRRLLRAEQRAIDTALARRGDGIATVDEQTVAHVVAARPTLTAEQHTMLTRLVTGGDGVAVVVGRAGTGKTYTLEAARDAWTRAGIPVHGVALAARAARELQDTSGIPATTIHRLLAQVDTGVGSPLKPGSVLVVDEAGMVGTRQLARLLEHAAEQRVKVVLVGDPRQLPEIDAGGLYAQLATRLDPIVLEDNRRQTARWEIAALDQLRHGDPSDALALYQQHGRVVTAETAEALREQLVSDWWYAAEQVGAPEAVMIALRKTDVADLNARARLRLHHAGRLHGPMLQVDGTEFQAGERILCLRNDRRLGVVNGTFATIQDVDPLHRSLTVLDDHGTVLELPAAYLDGGHVTHGYAITGHKAQGLTVDAAFVYGSDVLYREWGYVAMSRGRADNRLYVHAAATDPHGITHGRQPDTDPLAQTAVGLRRSAAKTPAVAHLDPDDLQQLGVRRRLAARGLARIEQRRTELQDRYQELSGQVARIEAEGERLRTRRGELGGLARLRKSAREEAANIDRRLERNRWELADTRRRIDTTRSALHELPDATEVDGWRGQLADLDRRIADAADVKTRHALRRPPDYILTTIGTAPEAGPDRDRWVAAVRAVEGYRIRFGIEHPDHPLGHPDLQPGQREARAQVLRRLLEAAPAGVHIEAHPERQRNRGLSRSRGLGISR